ncbi:ATP-dependent Clp protease proteolytic subunit [Candidatus Parcubacteria bacterium]|nr:ATP-dependent Clp protease proteolytic subunit [Candidatus Parcubacteria bacterium]
MSISERDINEAFLARRQILLQEEIKCSVQDRISASILYLNLQNNSTITLIINSGGGLAVSGMYICDAIRNSPAPVHGLVIGDAHSAAFDIFQHCDRRLCYKHARLMFHAIRLNDLPLDRDDFDDHIKEFREWDDELLRLFSKKSGQPLGRIRTWSRQERYFGAKEALKLGLIDEIVMPKRL